jgi:hypothetical protein
MKIINNGAGSNGNDFVMDDIEIRLCTPPVTLIQPPDMDVNICPGESLTFSGSYTDNGNFGNSPVYRWEKNTGDWHVIDGTRGNSTGGTVNSSYTIESIVAADTGYYRLAVADAASIDRYNCRAMSNIIHVRIRSCVFDDVATLQAYRWFTGYTEINVLANDRLPDGITSARRRPYTYMYWWTDTAPRTALARPPTRPCLTPSLRARTSADTQARCRTPSFRLRARRTPSAR